MSSKSVWPGGGGGDTKIQEELAAANDALASQGPVDQYNAIEHKSSAWTSAMLPDEYTSYTRYVAG